MSTVKLVDTTLQSSGPIFDINNSAVSGDDCAAYAGSGGFRSQLSGYRSADLARIDSLVGYVPGTGCKSPSDPTNPNLRVIAPADGAITVACLPAPPISRLRRMEVRSARSSPAG